MQLNQEQYELLGSIGYDLFAENKNVYVVKEKN
jgi:hypothetical protein